MNLIGAVIKYNPSSTYARHKKYCPDVKQKNSSYQYSKSNNEWVADTWFEKVVKGDIRTFYPKRVKLFEIPGTILVLYHCEMRAIVGEAKIVKSAQNGEVHNYYFDRFLLYPNKVSLTDENNKPRFYCIPTRGQWWVTYIDAVTLRGIRKLSGLKKKTLEHLDQDTSMFFKKTNAFFQIDSSTMKNRKARISKLDQEIDRLSAVEDSIILNQAKKIFLELTKTGVFGGYSFITLFYAVLYITYRKYGIAKSLRSISDDNEINLRELKSALKYLRRKFSISIPKVSLEKRVRQYSKQLNVSKEIIETSIKFAALAKEDIFLKNRNPRCIAAAALFASCIRNNIPITQKEISRVTNVTSVSLRTISNLMLKHEQLL